jgi:mono/diheme cytochrome c family protein
MIRNRRTIHFRVAISLVALSFLMLEFAACSKREEAAPPITDTTAAVAKADTSTPVSAPEASEQPAAISGIALAGQKIFYSTKYGAIKDACASCHSDGQPPTKDTRLRAGHTLAGVTRRTSTWNGAFTGDALQKNAFGATMCAVMYLHKGDAIATVMPKADIEALNAYFEAIKSSPGGISTNLKIQWVTKPAAHEEDKFDTKAANAAAKAIMNLPGDPAAGKNTFTRSCAFCHDLKEKQVGPSLSESMKDARLATRSVRCGSGAMPFYGKDIFSDQQIADVIAYIQDQLGK